MRTVTLELPDEVANVFESLPGTRKANAALLTAAFARSEPKSTEKLFDRIDERVAASGITEEEIDRLLEDLS